MPDRPYTLYVLPNVAKRLAVEEDVLTFVHEFIQSKKVESVDLESRMRNKAFREIQAFLQNLCQ